MITEAYLQGYMDKEAEEPKWTRSLENMWNNLQIAPKSSSPTPPKPSIKGTSKIGNFFNKFKNVKGKAGMYTILAMLGYGAGRGAIALKYKDSNNAYARLVDTGFYDSKAEKDFLKQFKNRDKNKKSNTSVTAPNTSNVFSTTVGGIGGGIGAGSLAKLLGASDSAANLYGLGGAAIGAGSVYAVNNRKEIYNYLESLFNKE